MHIKLCFIPLYLFTLLSFTLSGQKTVLEVKSDTFIEISDRGTPTMMLNQYYDKDTAIEVNLPFEISIADNAYSTVWVTSRGQVASHNPKQGYPYDVVSPFESNLQASIDDAIASPISYIVMGTAPERILVIEWKNSFFQELEGTFDHINMQAWFYEKDDIIEFRYGYSETELMYADYTTFGRHHFGGIVGFGSIRAYADYEGTWFYADSLSPSIVSIIQNDDSIGQFRLGFPPQGTVFHISKEESLSNSNPTSSNQAEIQFKQTEEHQAIIQISTSTVPSNYYIYNLNGHLFKNGPLRKKRTVIDLSKLNSGLYQISIPTERGRVWTKKFFINQ